MIIVLVSSNFVLSAKSSGRKPFATFHSKFHLIESNIVWVQLAKWSGATLDCKEMKSVQGNLKKKKLKMKVAS